MFREFEIHQRKLTIGTLVNIFRLQTALDNSCFVDGVQCFDQIDNPDLDHGLFKSAYFPQHDEKVSAHVCLEEDLEVTVILCMTSLFEKIILVC